jgi:hypothetical protein
LLYSGHWVVRDFRAISSGSQRIFRRSIRAFAQPTRTLAYDALERLRTTDFLRDTDPGGYGGEELLQRRIDLFSVTGNEGLNL